jgi:hypothetical protein
MNQKQIENIHTLWDELADIEGSDPQLRRHQTVLLPKPEACRSSRLTTQPLRP